MADLRKIAKELEPESIRKAVISASVQSPVTLYSGVIACLSGAYGALFTFSPASIAFLTIGAVVSLGNAGFQFGVNGESHANRIVERYRKKLNTERTKQVEQLKEKLTKHNGTVAIDQVELFTAKYNNFVEILDQKLSPGELTYNRYLTIAEQVFLGGLDNLEGYAIAKSSVKAIDVARGRDEIARLDAINNRSALDLKTYDELQERLRLHQAQTNKADEYLLENEQALTQLDIVSTRISDINTQQGHAKVDLEEAMDELKYLIEKADKYSNE